MTISDELTKEFAKVIEIKNVPWSVIEEVVQSDANVLRPITGVCFETFFVKTVTEKLEVKQVKLGKGDSDIDVQIQNNKLQLKTPDKGSTRIGERIGVALHKTHGLEKRPHNLYSKKDKLFDFLIFPHPEDGFLIVPFEEIPEHRKWKGYMADPARFEWNSKWLNRWDLLGFPEFKGVSIENRIVPKESLLPFLSSKTFLEDHEIIHTLINPSYFRAAVMGLKGNIKEHWLINRLKEHGYFIKLPTESYSKFDFMIRRKDGSYAKVQVKGTSKHLCNVMNNRIGVEIMGTHGQFPKRGYKKSYFDYIAIVISNEQLPKQYLNSEGLHFLFISSNDLPLYYLINQGDNSKDSGWKNKNWNLKKFSDVIYQNIKLEISFNNKTRKLEAFPDIDKYGKYKGYEVIPLDSRFRKAGPFILDYIPNEFISE